MAKPVRSISRQVKDLFHQSGINQVGNSKHDAKLAIIEKFGEKTWAIMGQNLGIHSYKTAKNYMQVWRNFGEFAKENFNIKDMKMLRAEHVKSYLETRADKSHQTFKHDKSALGKLGVILGKSEEFQEVIKDTKEITKALLVEAKASFESRVYHYPKDLISELNSSVHALCASIQLEGGARWGGVSTINPNRLRGEGYVLVNEKGGKWREIVISKETYKKLEEHLEKNNGEMKVAYNSYLADLKQASAITNQAYKGTHGLRWNYAQNRVNELTSENTSYREAKLIVSEELGHHRSDITRHYLR